MSGIYVHIPFCKSRCVYCDFFSTTRVGMVDTYLDALSLESSLRRDTFHDISLPPYDTLYIGGGTPSVLSLNQVERLMSFLRRDYILKEDAEVTMECNPEDVSMEYLLGLKSLGINRLSYGVQTFDEQRLQFLCRRHDSKKAIDAVEKSRSVGFENISIDLMFGFPGETLELWENDIDRAISLGVPHISAYSLMLEPGTRLTKMVHDGFLEPLGEESYLLMYELLVEMLTSSGYEHYEISNFSKPGFSSRHNESYWHGVPYLGLGAGAHSYDGAKVRRWNLSDLDEYIKGLEDSIAYYDDELLSDRDLYNEYVMTRLRTSDGISLKEMKEKFPKDYIDTFVDGMQKYISGGEIIYDGEVAKLSEKGLMLSNYVMSDLFVV